ncbi:helix-turn-helix domain-containing protein [Flavobacterium litorale]|uniref:Helix-turn-helix domain-containing protein n=1 Tax=Flavobacterium litorale TaxID=2856519 RepID=A0ABX8VA71_9FLAO|nr:helix-turn-helix transcriptional regulator [Flavobacterium litorale]QYJ67926.1 helix-turn-helix domain-containing protein [Flavobacterium litorale]
MTRKKEIPEIVVQVGKRIREVIHEKGLKVRHVAADADLDIEALRRYIAGKQVMGIDKLVRIANALGVQVGELFKV